MLPFHTAKVGHTQPRLVYVDDSGLRLKRVKVPKRKLLPQDQVSDGVLVKADRFDFIERHAHVVLHDLSDKAFLILSLTSYVEPFSKISY
jgi:hypothetical protein